MNGSSSSGGFGQGLENILGNPLVQTALAGYLGAIGSPRYKGIGGALSQGGLTGLEAFSQAEQLKQQTPLLQAQTQLAQQQVPLAKQQVQLGARQVAPLDPKVEADLNTYIASSKDPEEQQQLAMLRDLAKSQQITPAELSSALKSFDENKRLMELYKGQGALYGNQLTAGLLGQMFPNIQLPAPPGTGAAPSAMPPTSITPSTSPGGPAAPSGSTAAAAGDIDGIPPGGMGTVNVPGFGDVQVQRHPDGSYFYNEGGQWKPLS